MRFIKVISVVLGIVIVIIITSVNSKGATKIDSLQNLLAKHTTEDTIRVNLLNETAAKYFASDRDKAYTYAIESNELANKLQYTNGQAVSYKYLAYYYIKRGEFDQSLDYYKQALAKYEILSNKKELNKCLNNIGIIYKNQGKYYQSLHYQQQALKLKEAIKDSSGIYSSLVNIGNLYYTLKKFDAALDYYNQALIYKEFISEGLYTALLNNVGVVQQKLGHYSKSLEYYNQALEIRKRLNDNEGLCDTYTNLGSVNQSLKNYELAIGYYEKSLKIANTEQDKVAICENTIGLAEIYLKQKRFNKAYSKSVNGYNLAKEIGGLEQQNRSSQLISECCAKLNKYHEAYAYSVIHKTISDSLFNHNNESQLTNLENQYQFNIEKEAIAAEQAKKDAIKNAEIERQTFLRNISILGILVLAAFILFVLKQNNTIRKQKAEKELLMKEMNHRIKNNLQIVSGLLDLQMLDLEDEKVRLSLKDAQSCVASIALIHQTLYQNESDRTINLNQSVVQLAEHIKTSYNMNGVVSIQTNIDKALRINVETAVTLGLILTELLTNSYKYAFSGIENPEIVISIDSSIGQAYQMRYADNGKGLPEDFSIQKSKSLGLKLVKSLSKQLNGKPLFKSEQGAIFEMTFEQKESAKKYV